MRVGISLVLFMVLLVGCATTSKTPIHKVVSSTTVRAKVVLLDNGAVDFAYQRATVREFEAQLLKKPVTFALRSTLSGQEIDFVLVTRKDIQKINSIFPEEIVRLGQESDINTLIVLEPQKVDYKEGSAKRGEEFCVSRMAEVLVSARVYETKTGGLIFGGVYTGKSKARQCSQGIRRTDKLPSKDVLILRALRKAGAKFAGEFWSAL